METKEVKPIMLERFTLTRYNNYIKKGIPFRIFDSSHNECRILNTACGENNEELAVEYNHNDRIFVRYYNKKGKNGNSELIIWTGCIDIQKGDVILNFWNNKSGNGFFFYSVFKSVGKASGLGFSTKWEIDCYGGQFAPRSLFHDFYINNKINYVRKATKDEEKDYWSLLRSAGYERDNNGIHWIPKAGQSYYTIEIQNGTAVVVQKDAPETAYDVPSGNRLCFSSQSDAGRKAQQINETISKKY